mmetsp:Transcript_58771/g.118043  ORF Transcript_58771/g.118043 Transcript_58771/m.118043 type:complete len:231 (-) Transcript_58771:80-772(-)
MARGKSLSLRAEHAHAQRRTHGRHARANAPEAEHERRLAVQAEHRQRGLSAASIIVVGAAERVRDTARPPVAGAQPPVRGHEALCRREHEGNRHLGRHGGVVVKVVKLDGGAKPRAKRGLERMQMFWQQPRVGQYHGLERRKRHEGPQALRQDIGRQDAHFSVARQGCCAYAQIHGARISSFAQAREQRAFGHVLPVVCAQPLPEHARREHLGWHRGGQRPESQRKALSI